jgi:hypothetical protein
MKTMVLLPTLTCLAGSICSAQTPSPISLETARMYFAEAESLCQADDGQLWAISLCGPMMFVDPNTRTVVANHPDAGGRLQAEGGAFIGSLPPDQVMANTAVDWSGVRWTQMVWPLPEDERERDTLILHELFHRVQNRLNVPKIEGIDNVQLDTPGGRYYLQLEWRALARALEARTDQDRREASEDALVFRTERYRLFPDAVVPERALELNEGLAEYTGVRAGNPTPVEQNEAALRDLTTHTHDSTFVRSVAYATGPAYGLLLDRYAPGWRKELGAGAGLDGLLRGALRMTLPPRLQMVAEQRARSYDGPALRDAETKRETKRQQTVASYRAAFIDGPILTLRFRKMHVQFDPRTLQPLDKVGTVYPSIRISDEWGVLEAQKGALMKSDWSGVSVVAPPSIEGSNIHGDGWTLTLKPGWKIIPGARKGDFLLASSLDAAS